MTKRKIKKTTKIRLTVFGTLSIIAIFSFLFNAGYQAYNLYNLTIEKKQLEKKYSKLKEEAEDLKIEIKQLNDPEYLAKYARENYSYSKKGEYIIKLNETDEKIDQIDDTINKEYIIIGLSIFLAFIFIYVIKRGHKKSK